MLLIMESGMATMDEGLLAEKLSMLTNPQPRIALFHSAQGCGSQTHQQEKRQLSVSMIEGHLYLTASLI
jgi:hypothetical protein